MNLHWLFVRRQWHRNQDNELVTADAVYIVRNTALCPNKANSWPIASGGLVEETTAAPAPAGNCPALLCHAMILLCDVAASWRQQTTYKHMPCYICLGACRQI